MLCLSLRNNLNVTKQVTAIVRTRCNFILKPNVEKTELQCQTAAEVTVAALERHACQHPATRLLSSRPQARVTAAQRGPAVTWAGRLVSMPVPRADASALTSTRSNGTGKRIHGKVTTQLSNEWSLTRLAPPAAQAELGDSSGLQGFYHHQPMGVCL